MLFVISRFLPHYHVTLVCLFTECISTFELRVAAIPGIQTADLKGVVREAMDERDAEQKEITVCMSDANGTNTRVIFSKLNIVAEDYEEEEEEEAPVSSTSTSTTTTVTQTFLPFNWNGQNETEGTADACEHLFTELKKFACNFGRGGYKLVDLHLTPTLLNFEDPKVGKFSGGTDLVIVPYKIAESSAAVQLCVLFELKTEQNVTEKGLEQFVNQAYLELVASRCLSSQPSVLVILTDLCSGSIALWLDYDLANKRFAVQKQRLTLSAMAKKVSGFLKSTAKPDAGYRPLEERNDPKELDVLTFKRTKLTPVDCLAWEHFNAFVDDSKDWSKERGELTADLFHELGYERIPSLVHHSMYA